MNRTSLGLLLGLLTTMPAFVGCGGGDDIQRVSRQNNSGTYHYFREAVLGEDRELRLGSMDQSGSKDVVEMVAKTPNAIGYSGMGYATSEVKMLRLSQEPGGAAIAPTVEAAKDGSYPLARPLHIYTVGEPSGALKHYLEWIHAEEGQAILEEMGYVSTGVEPMTDDAPPEAGTIKTAGSDTMMNVAQRWAEVYMQKYPQVNIQVDGGGSGTGIKQLIDGTIQMANASRDMKPEEMEQAAERNAGEVSEFTVGLDALAIYVHKDNPIDEISIPELAEIYGEGGTITKWSQMKGNAESGN
jgi:ABC-type phosphate transport system substrate-binding protein